MRLILLYVKQPQETIQGEFGLIPPEPEPADADILERLGEQLPEDTTIQVERLVAHGKAAEAIVQVAKEKHCDLIVLGTHGRKGLGHLFYGNVADSVTRSCHMPGPGLAKFTDRGGTGKLWSCSRKRPHKSSLISLAI